MKASPLVGIMGSSALTFIHVTDNEGAAFLVSIATLLLCYQNSTLSIQTFSLSQCSIENESNWWCTGKEGGGFPLETPAHDHQGKQKYKKVPGKNMTFKSVRRKENARRHQRWASDLSGYEQLTSCLALCTYKPTPTFFTIGLSFTGYQGNRIINCCFPHTNYTRKLIMILAVSESLYSSYKLPVPLSQASVRACSLDMLPCILPHLKMQQIVWMRKNNLGFQYMFTKICAFYRVALG